MSFLKLSTFIFSIFVFFLFLFLFTKSVYASDYTFFFKVNPPCSPSEVNCQTYPTSGAAKTAADAYNCAANPRVDYDKQPPQEIRGPNETVGGYFVVCKDVTPTLPPTAKPTTPPNPVIGTITPPGSIPTTGADPSAFVAGLFRGLISFLIIAAFVVALFWTMFAGYRLIISGSDPKTVGAAWSQIYWGLFGLAIVVGAYAIIKLAELFFGINIVSGGFQLPRI